MRPTLKAGTAAALAAASALTIVMAWPVVRAPGTLIFGNELVGRHHDPFTVIQQFAAGGAAGPYLQPLTDMPGVWLARLIGAIAAYNLVVLVSFPLTAVATYWLARYLLRSHAGALVAALGFAFAPVHLAHAGYHIHIAQTQWIPLHLLALVAAIDRPNAIRLLGLAGATAALPLANAYAGLIGIVITPVVIAARWATCHWLRWPHLVRPFATLAGVSVVAFAFVAVTIPELLTDPEQFAFPADDVARYGARWWNYVVPSVDHPVLAGTADRLVREPGPAVALLEQQVWLGWAWMVLAVLGVFLAGRALVLVPVLGVWAFLASLGPGAGSCLDGSPALPCMIHPVLPMFRAYARFGVVVSLCASLLAGHAVATLAARAWPSRRRTMVVRLALGTLLVLGALEWWPMPGRARDVLPTAAHRWLAGQPPPARAVDCVASSPADYSLTWLMQREIRSVDTLGVEVCDAPEIPGALAALGFTHLVVRDSSPPDWWSGQVPDGLALEAAFADGAVYRVLAPPAPIVVMSVRGFHALEGDSLRRSRWMGQAGSWTVVNTTTRDLIVHLDLGVEAFARSRRVQVTVDGRPVRELQVPPGRIEPAAIGPLALAPGSHLVEFRPVEPATQPAEVDGSVDERPLTIRIHSTSWSVAAP